MNLKDLPDARQFIIETSKAIVTKVAPEEMDMFDELLAEYFQNPEHPDMKSIPDDDPLGFGSNDLIFAVTPAAAEVASVVLGFLVGVFLSVASKKKNVTEIVQAMLSEKTGKLNKKPHLTLEQLDYIYKIAFQAATQYGMDINRSHNMVNALIVTLTLPTVEEIAPGTSDQKVKILFLASNPTNTPRLEIDEEIRAIESVFRRAESYNTFELIQHWAVRVSELQELLLYHKPNIVHFSGHGNRYGEFILKDQHFENGK